MSCPLVFQPFGGDQLEDISSELFSSFFDDHLLERPLLAVRPPLLHMDIDSSSGEPPDPLITGTGQRGLSAE